MKPVVKKIMDNSLIIIIMNKSLSCDARLMQ